MVDVPTTASAAPAPQKKPKTALIAGVAAALVVVVGLGAFLAGRGGGTSPSSSAPGTGGEPVNGMTSVPTAIDDDLPPLKKAEVPSITIQGQEYSTDLRELKLENASLTSEDFDQLKYMVNLTNLSIRGNSEFHDLSFLSNLTELRSVYIDAYWDDFDLAPLAGLTELEVFNVNPSSGNPDGTVKTQDLTPLTGLTKLRVLTLYSDAESLNPLAGLTNLERLWVFGTSDNNGGFPLTDISALSNMTKMQELNLEMGVIKDLTPLNGMTEMKTLYISAYQADIPSLEPLSGMTKMEDLVLCFDEVDAGLAGLENFTNVTSATIDFNRAYNSPGISLEPITSWDKISRLSLNLNIADGNLTPLANLTNLRDLNIYFGSWDHPIRNLEPLRALTKLQNLHICPAADGIDLSPVEHVPSVNVQ